MKCRGRDVMYHYRVLLYSCQHNRSGYQSIVQQRTLDPVISYAKILLVNPMKEEMLSVQGRVDLNMERYNA